MPEKNPGIMPVMNFPVRVGVAHGRFQLFHNDHLKYVLEAKKRCEMLVIGITSPDPVTAPREPVDPHRADPSANPLTYYERMRMITACLQSEGIDASEFAIVPFPIEQPDRLFNYSPREATYFITIYDDWGNEKLRRLEVLGLSTYVLWRTYNKGISGSEIRDAITHGQDWRSCVPPAAIEYIQQNKIDLRIRELQAKRQDHL